jgi:hypothetical protein
MKFTLLVLVFAAFALMQNLARAQNRAPSSTPQDSCGAADLKFDVEHDNSQLPPSDPEPGKALVYVIEVFDSTAGEMGTPTVRVGLDGSWIGANRGSSYLFFPVDPGGHHLCTNWQSTLQRPSAQPSRTDFSAEAGKTYFFQAQIRAQTTATGGEVWSIDLQSVAAEEAKYLIADSPLSISHPKKRMLVTH